MARRPTRSQTDTPTRKELARRLDELGGSDYDDLDPLTLCELLSYDLETVDEQNGHRIVRVVETGELRRAGGGNRLGEVVTANNVTRGGDDGI